MIRYQVGVAGVAGSPVAGFFVGWPVAPDEAAFWRVMSAAHRCVLALEGDRLIGFVHALSDGLNAFIPWLEVHPDHQGRGIGGELLARLVAELEGHYAIDLCCDPELVAYYETRGFRGLAGAGLRFPAALAPDGPRRDA